MNTECHVTHRKLLRLKFDYNFVSVKSVMAECQHEQRVEDKQQAPSIASDFTEAFDSIPPLRLPDGVTPDTAAKLVTSIVLRQAYSCSNPLSQWVLLAALEVLHGYAVPKLDPEAFLSLQGTQCEEPIIANGSTSEGGKSLSFLSKKQKEEVSIRLNPKLDSDNKVRSTCTCKHTGTTAGGFSIDKNSKINNYQKPSDSHADFGMQVTPRALGIISTKWIQVKRPRTINCGIQVEPKPNDNKMSKNAKTQTHFRGYVGSLDARSVDKETQTVFKSKKNSGSQTQSSKEKWKLQPISALPKKPKASQNRIHKASNPPLPDTTSALGSLRLLIPGLGSVGDMNPGPDSSDSRADYDADEVETTSSSAKTLLFHGRPLVKVKSTVEPKDIPIKQLVPGLKDPRMGI